MKQTVFDRDAIEVLDYCDDFKEHIKKLNYEWLEKYFRLEKGDVVSLSNPKEEIIDKGGYVFFAKVNREFAGTISLLKKTDDIFELGKMAVTAEAQGRGIGTVLIEHCLTFAKQKSIRKIILYSNSQLQSAIHLYKKFGFKEIALEQGLYDRANIKMQLDL